MTKLTSKRKPKTTKTTARKTSSATSAKTRSSAQTAKTVKTVRAKPAPATKPAPVTKLVSVAKPVVARPDLKKKELVDLVVARSGIKKKDAKPVVEAMLAVLGETIASGRELNLQPLGKLRINRATDKGNGTVIICKLRQSKPVPESAGVRLAPVLDKL